MLGVTKEVPKMADYYLKTDNIMKNMFTVALKDELAAQSQMGKVRPATEAMLQKVCSYELSEKRLPSPQRNNGNFAMPSIGCETSIWPWADTAMALTV